MGWFCNTFCKKEESKPVEKPVETTPEVLPPENKPSTEYLLLKALDTSRFPETLIPFLMAQWRYESGHFKSDLATKHFNFAGLKWREEMTGIAQKVSYNAHDGINDYCKFQNVQNFVDGYWTFIHRGVYGDVDSVMNDGEAYLKHIVKMGYCPDNGYVEGVLSLVNPINNHRSTGLKVALIVGHNKTAQGANNYLGESEFSFNSRIARKVNALLGDDCVVIYRPSGSYHNQCVSAANEAQKFSTDLAICLHFNAYNGKTQGCEVLILNTVDELDNHVADKITDSLNEQYGFDERGDDGVRTINSSHAGFGMLWELKKKNIIAVLIEPCFADNPSSKVIFEDEDKYVQVLASSILEGI